MAATLSPSGRLAYSAISMSDDTARADPETRARTHLANERTFLAWFRTAWR
ncbi:MAG: DUF202 domain-containing protein [Candidatus Limnocylindrales bacterium]